MPRSVQIGFSVLPIIISPRGIEHWMHRYGSEAPDHIFKAAMRAWESARTIDQPAFHQSEAFRKAHYADMRAFTTAIGLTA